MLEKNGIPGAVAGLVIGDRDVGEAVVESELVDMGMFLYRSFLCLVLLVYLPCAVSFTGSERVGRQVGKVVQSRFGKVLLELGGNNGMYTLYMIVPYI